MKMKHIVAIAGVLALGIGAASADIIPLTNGGFEDPASGKTSDGFDNTIDVPGWYDLGINTDTGVESGGNTGSNTGSWGAFFMGGDAGAGQDTAYTIQEGDVFRVSFYARNIWNAGSFQITLVDDAANVLGSYVANPVDGAYTLFSGDIAATAASVGNNLSIQLAGTGAAGGSWTAIDDVTIETVPEPATIGLIATMGGALLLLRRRFMA